MASEERFIKNKFTVKVPAYIWASSAPGLPIPIKKYVSAPVIDFEVAPIAVKFGNPPEEISNSYLLGNDDPTLPIDEQKNSRLDQRDPGWRQQRVQPSNSQERIDANDPALGGYPRGMSPAAYEKIKIGNKTQYVKITNVNPTTGETVYTAIDPAGLKIIAVDK